MHVCVCVQARVCACGCVRSCARGVKSGDGQCLPCQPNAGVMYLYALWSCRQQQCDVPVCLVVR